MGRRKKLKNIKIPIEILGILLIVIGIIGFLGYKANIVGKYVKGAGMLLMGSLYFVFLALLIIIGGYMLIKRKRPKYLTLKTIGAALFFIGVLSLAHLALSNMNLDKSLGIKENMEIGFNTFVNCLENKEVFTGGGLIGLFFVLVLDKFLGYIGSIIVIAVIMFIGLVLFSNFSLLDIISSLSDKVKIKKSNNDDEYEEDEDDDEEEVKGHGLKDNRVAISSIDELTNPKQEEEYKQSMKESLANSFNNTNLYKDYKLPDIDLLAKPSKTKNTTRYRIIY